MNSKDIPKGWFCYEARQDLSFMLWYVILMSFDDVINNVEQPRHVLVEEKDSFEEALAEAIAQVNNLQNHERQD